ncbi:hypothetical protein AX16_010343 [Volvariella volvacea WC 439]|nr:hypothetical protein AX16_010343 [Volvariella volvacea WC 439]
MSSSGSLIALFPFNALYVALYIFPLIGQWTATYLKSWTPGMFVWSTNEHIVLSVTTRFQMYFYTLLFVLNIAQPCASGFVRPSSGPLEGRGDHAEKLVLGIPPGLTIGAKRRPNFRLRLHMLFAGACWRLGRLVVIAGFVFFIVMIGYASSFRRGETYYDQDISDTKIKDVIKTVEEYGLGVVIVSDTHSTIGTDMGFWPKWQFAPHVLLHLMFGSVTIERQWKDVDFYWPIPIKDISDSNCSIPARQVELSWRKTSEPNDIPTSLTTPDLPITVDWDTDNETTTPGRHSTLSVLIGMVPDPMLIMQSTKPIHLVRNTNTIANVVLYIRQAYPATTSFNTHSLFTNRKPSWLQRLLRVERDNAEGALIAGLSALSGLWTTSNIVFTFLFGDTLPTTLFGIKYFTHFGLIHKLNGRELREDYDRAYPQLLTEGGRKGDSEAGMATFLRDYAFDMQPTELRPRGPDGQYELEYRQVSNTEMNR